EHWFNLADAAGSRFEDAALKHYDAVARVGWEAPAFSRETIAADPWTAVYLPIPERADAGLLAAARSWASDLRQYATADGVLSGPFINRAHYTREGNVAAAERRIVELDRCLETLRKDEPAQKSALWSGQR